MVTMGNYNESHFTDKETEDQRLVQGHTAIKCLSWDSNPDLFGPSTCNLINHPQGPGCLSCDFD